MSFPFLTDRHYQEYGRYTEPPSPQQLVSYFHLDDADRLFIESQTRLEHTQLGLALHLGTVRFLGRFRPLRSVPEICVRYVAQQLNLNDTIDWPESYEARPSTRWEQIALIREHYGYRQFNDQPEHFQLTRWLYARAWFSAERPSVLFDMATHWLIEHKVLLPGVNTLARFVTGVRQRVLERVWWHLSQSLSASQAADLQTLLVRQGGEAFTPFEKVSRSTGRISSRAVVQTIRRLKVIRQLDVGDIDLSRVPPNRLRALARHAQAVKAQTVERMHIDRQLATLLAYARFQEAELQDEILDLFDALLKDHLKDAKLAAEAFRLQTRQMFGEAAIQLMEACQVMLEPDLPDQQLRAAIFAQTPPSLLEQAISTVRDMTQPHRTDEWAWLIDSYPTVRRYFPHLLRTLTFYHVGGSEEVLNACDFLYQMDNEKPAPHFREAPRALISRRWRPLAIDERGELDQVMYTFCVMLHLNRALHQRNVFITPSHRWHDPRARLIPQDLWPQMRPQVCRLLGLSPDDDVEMDRLAVQVDNAYRQAIESFDDNTDVWVEPDDEGRLRLHLSRLEAVENSLPPVDLSQLLLEIHQITGFADEFVHVSETYSHAKDLSLSVCAVLMSEACNIPLASLVDHDVEALSEDRLLWVKQHHIRAETLARANARLVDAQSAIGLARHWGGGQVASVDGLRFVVPVHSLHTGYSSKYFGSGRGVTYINFTSDQFTGFHGIVVAGAVREAPYLLDGLLENQSGLDPVELISDSGGYTDVIFGLFWLLGYQFSPRLADIGSARFWRMDRQADYGPLDSIARHNIRRSLPYEMWDELLRVGGSLKLGLLTASELVLTLRSGTGESSLTKALKEIGRIAKTLYLLAYIHDEAYRRRVLIQLNRSEARHRLARAIFFGRRGELRRRYRMGQEDQLGALGLVTNVVVLWNTIYMDAALRQLEGSQILIEPEAVARLSPLGFQHIRFLGRYDFSLDEHVVAGQLRPIRDPFDPDRRLFS